MKVILKSDIKELGLMGNMVAVKDGYARNYLLPKGLAVEANEKNMKALEHEKRKIQHLIKKVKAGAEDMAAKIAAVSLTITAKAGEEDKLFGSVTAMDIAEALKGQGIEIDKRKIALEEPIKRLGSYSVGVKLHSDVTAQFSLQVVGE